MIPMSKTVKLLTRTQAQGQERQSTDSVLSALASHHNTVLSPTNTDE